jgi:hypothetical protein
MVQPCFAAIERGDAWADIIDVLTMHPESRQVVRLLGEIDTQNSNPFTLLGLGRSRVADRLTF